MKAPILAESRRSGRLARACAREIKAGEGRPPGPSHWRENRIGRRKGAKEKTIRREEGEASCRELKGNRGFCVLSIGFFDPESKSFQQLPKLARLVYPDELALTAPYFERFNFSREPDCGRYLPSLLFFLSPRRRVKLIRPISGFSQLLSTLT